MQYFVYALRSIPSGRYYIGMTADVDRRLSEHNSRAGRWTSSFRPWRLLGTEEFMDRRTALARERFLKSRPGIAERRRWLALMEERQSPMERVDDAEQVERP